MFLSKRELYHFPPWHLQAPPIFKFVGKEPFFRLLHTLDLNLIASYYIYYISYILCTIFFLQPAVPVFVLCVYGFKPDHSTWNSQLISGGGQVFFCEKSVVPVVLCHELDPLTLKRPIDFCYSSSLVYTAFSRILFYSRLATVSLRIFLSPPLPHCSLKQRCRSSDVDMSTGAGSPWSLDLCIVFVFFLALVRYGGHTYMRM